VYCLIVLAPRKLKAKASAKKKTGKKRQSKQPKIQDVLNESDKEEQGGTQDSATRRKSSRIVRIKSYQETSDEEEEPEPRHGAVPDRDSESAKESDKDQDSDDEPSSRPSSDAGSTPTKRKQESMEEPDSPDIPVRKRVRL
jgi:hypothetical protein